MRIRISDLFAITALSAGYGTLYRVDSLPQAIVAILLVCGSLLWILMAPTTIRMTTGGARTLRHPWLMFVFGFILFPVGVWIYLPNADRMATANFWRAVEVGYDDHVEESETIVLGIVGMGILFGFPSVLAAGLVGAVCSEQLKLRGVGRYALAFTLALMPLVIGILPTIRYAWIAQRLANGG